MTIIISTIRTLVQFATCSHTSLSMARVLIIAILALLLLQLAAGQNTTSRSRCRAVLETFAVNVLDCTATRGNLVPQQIFRCTGQCRNHYNDFIERCNETVSIEYIADSYRFA